MPNIVRPISDSYKFGNLTGSLTTHFEQISSLKAICGGCVGN
jgi:hypothetical protein